MLQASTQGLVQELQRQGRAEGARVLCPVPLVTEGLVEPPVIPRFLKALEVMTLWCCIHPHAVSNMGMLNAGALHSCVALKGD